jgi:CBS domain-containing protein
MASNPQCCLSLIEWKQYFSDLIDRGTPEDLLKASIFFDFRGLAGQQEWANDLRRHVMSRIRNTPRFIHQCVENSRAFSVPLNWHGGLQGVRHGNECVINIKLTGTALVVDAARIMSLAKGVTATRTVERLHAAAVELNVPETDYKSWITAFEYLQMLRLQRQIQPDVDGINANQINLESLNLVDKRMLKVAFSAVRHLQQRISFDDLR